MGKDIRITPGSAKIGFSGSSGNTIDLLVEPSGSLNFSGASGSLFGISDNFSGSLMSVSDISGIPILEVFDDDRVVMGKYSAPAMTITGSFVGIGTSAPAGQNANGPILHLFGKNASGTLNEPQIVFQQTGEPAMSIGVNANLDSGAAMLFQTNGSNIRMSIRENGDIGINTTSPAQQLAGANRVVQIKGELVLEDGAGNSTFLALGGAQNAKNYVASTGTIPLHIRTNSTDAIVIDASQNVGIGTTSPDTTLDIHGSFTLDGNGSQAQMKLRADQGDSQAIYFTNAASGYEGAIVYDNTGTTTENMKFNVNQGTRMTILASGNVGIGTTSPADTLHLEDGNSTKIRFSYGSGLYINQIANEFDSGNAANNKMRFYVSTSHTSNTVEALTLVGNGNVGIGSTAPTQTLDVVGGGAFTTSVFFNGRVRINHDGQVHWGASYNQGYLSWNTNEAIIGGLASNALRLQSGGATTMFMDTSQNVGIGTTSPGTLLHLEKADAQPVLLISRVESNFDPGIVDNDVVGEIQFAGREGAGNSPNVIAKILGVANETFGSTSGRGELQFQTGDESAVSTKMTIDHNGHVGIGQAVSGHILNINSADTIISLTETGGNSGAYLDLGRAKGTVASPSDLDEANLELGRIRFMGRESSGYREGARIQAFTSGVWNGGDYRSHMVFSTVPNGSTTPAERLRIDYVGNVGIGQTSPFTNLEVNGDIGLGRMATSTTKRIGRGHSTGMWTYSTSIDFITTSGFDGDIAFNTFESGVGDNTPMYISGDAGGKVGIGTTSPVGKLHVLGSSYNHLELESASGNVGITFDVETSNTNYYDWRMDAQGTAANTFCIGHSTGLGNQTFSAASMVLALKNGPLVGIGTTAPIRALDIVVASGDPGIRLESASQSADVITLRNADGRIGLGRDAITTLSNGDVGIGNASPQVQFQVGGNTNGISFDIMPSWNRMFLGQNVKASSTNGRMVRIASSTTDYPSAIAFGYQDVGGFGSEDSKGGINFITVGSNISGDIDPDTYSRMYIHKDGNIGIGETSPDSKLHIKGLQSGLILERADNDAKWEFSSDSQKLYLRDLNTGTGYVGLTVSGSGNVGIGTASPDAKLDILGPSDGVNLRLSDVSGNASTKEARIGLRHYTEAEEDTALMYAQSGNGTSAVYIGGGTGVMNAVETIGFVTAATDTTLSGTTRMLIDSSGRVGINQGSPSAVLEVKGQTGVASTALITHGLVQFKTTHNDSSELRHQFNMGGASDAGSYVIKQGDASTNGIILAAGDDSYIANNLGIGQASPSYKLDVSGTGRFTGALTTANILLGAGSILYLDGGSNTYIKQTSGDVIGIFTGGNNRMTIDSGGRVGINNSLPEELLHIKSSANSATPVIRLENTNAGVYAPQINLYNNSSSPADNDYLGQIDFEGKDSAGNRTEYARIIASTADVTATIEDGILDFDVFYNGTLTNALRIRGMGGGAYVGIGETNPDEKLEVNGNVKINNSIIFGGQNMKIVGNTSTPALELRGGVSGQVRVYCDETLRWTFDDGGDLSSPSNHISTGGKMSVGSGTEAQPGYQLGSSNDGFFHDGGIKVVVNNAVDFLMADGGTFHADADVVAYSTTISDERLKDDVKTIDSALDKVKRLRGVEYVWSHGSKKGQKDIGVIAQETEKVIPEIVQEKEMPLWSAKDPEVSGKYKMVDYEKLTAVLIESVKEQQKQIDELKSELQELKDGSSR